MSYFLPPCSTPCLPLCLPLCLPPLSPSPSPPSPPSPLPPPFSPSTQHDPVNFSIQLTVAVYDLRRTAVRNGVPHPLTRAVHAILHKLAIDACADKVDIPQHRLRKGLAKVHEPQEDKGKKRKESSEKVWGY